MNEGLSRFEFEMSNPGYIPDYHWTGLYSRISPTSDDIPRDGQQHTMDLQTFAMQIEQEVERLEEAEVDAIQRQILPGEDRFECRFPAQKEILTKQLSLLEETWCGENPFVCSDDEQHRWGLEGFSDFEPLTPTIVEELYDKLLQAIGDKRGLRWFSESGENFQIIKHEALNYCVKNWSDPRCRQVVRWILDAEGLINVIREGSLARLRFWITRVTAGKYKATDRRDMIGLVKISKAVLCRVRAAYTWEAPSSFLGTEDDRIVSWTYPILFGIPAECTVSNAQIEAEWRDNVFGGGWFERASDSGSIEEWTIQRRYLYESKWHELRDSDSCASKDAYDVDFECRTAGIRMVEVAIREAKRFGMKFELPDIDTESTALEWVDRIVSRTLALGSELPSDQMSEDEWVGWKSVEKYAEAANRSVRSFRDYVKRFKEDGRAINRPGTKQGDINLRRSAFEDCKREENGK